MSKNNKLEDNINLDNQYILVLPSWYPSDVDRFNGDFNERLVTAIAEKETQVVVYLVWNKENKKKRTVFSIKDNVYVYIVYIPHFENRLRNVVLFVKSYLNQIDEVFKKFGRPKLLHTYVFFPAGIISLYLKYRYGFKSVLTEHWTAFYEENKGHLKSQNFFKRLIYRKILRSFDVIIPVAKRLGEQIESWSKSRKIVIHNVVETKVFNYKKEEDNRETFKYIHVSSLNYQKNIDGLLSTFERLLKRNEAKDKIELVLIGMGDEKLEHRIKSSPFLCHSVNYKGILPYEEVAMEMKKANAFVLFSRYENMPCVLLESLCCGLPIVSSKVGGIAEIIDNTNGILIDSENEKQLEEAMLKMVEEYDKYNQKEIAEKAMEKYSYKSIGLKISEIYNGLC